MPINLDKALVDQVRNLKMDYEVEPQPELLIKIPNRTPKIEYEVEITTKEFTSLCPLNTSQPDYAEIVIKYTPDLFLVELKSLKFYLVSFRMVSIFHEEVPVVILEALKTLLEPRDLGVVGHFTTRGGLDTTVTAVYYDVGAGLFGI